MRYQQETDINLLVQLLALLENKAVIDVGAEKGSFIEALLDHGAEKIYAFEPFPANVNALRERFSNLPQVHIFDVALGARDEIATLHIAQDKTGGDANCYHSLIASADTPTIHWADQMQVKCRTLNSLVNEGSIPSEVSILKVDTEGNDFAVVQGMDGLHSSIVMIEYWNDLPETVGAYPVPLEDFVAEMHKRGYSNFAFIKRWDEFESIQLNSTYTISGDWGNVIFIHDSVAVRLLPTIYANAATVQDSLLKTALMFKTECDNRLKVIEVLDNEVKRQTNSLRKMSATVQKHKRGDITVDNDQSVNEASTVTMEEAVALEELRQWAYYATEQQKDLQRTRVKIEELMQALNHRKGNSRGLMRQHQALSTFVRRLLGPIYRKLKQRFFNLSRPKLGVLQHYSPRPIQLPQRYKSIRSRVNPAPGIAIVTPAYNHARFLETTIKSVLDQNYPNLEYVIQDGGSKDGTTVILERYQSRLTHAESVKDTGQANAINRGFLHTTAEIMAYLNSDDLLLPGALNYVAKYFATHPNVDVVYGHRIIIDEYNQEIGRWVLPAHDDEVLSWADYIPQETLFWRRRIWEKVGGYIDESFQFAMDWDLLLRFRQANAHFVRLPRFLGAFRVHTAQKTSAQINDVGIREMSILRERHNGYPVTSSQIKANIKGYLNRHCVYHALYRLGIMW
jgi:FkbM family methyltransferase